MTNREALLRALTTIEGWKLGVETKNSDFVAILEVLVRIELARLEWESRGSELPVREETV